MVDITGQYLLNLLMNGLLIGVIYALMALGLTLIFSVLIVRWTVSPGL